MYDGEATGVGHVPSWMVIDQRYRNRYLFAGLSPRQPFPGRWYKNGTVEKAATLERAGRRDRRTGRGARRRRSPGSTASPDRRRRGLPPRRERLRQVLLRPDGEAEPVAQHHRPRRRSTPSRSSPATSAPRAAWSPTSGPGCCVPTARSSPACTPPATSPSAVMGHTYAGPGATIGPASPSATWPRRTSRRAVGRAPVGEGDRLMPIDPAVAIGADLGQSRSRGRRATCCSTTSASARARGRRQPRPRRAAVDHRRCDLQVLPSFGVVAPTFHETEAPSVEMPGVQIDLSQVVHGSQAITVPAPLPTSGSATRPTTLTDVWDKGKAAVIWQEGVATAPTPASELWTTRSSIFVRGEGGFGGDRGTSEPVVLPDRAADADGDVRDHAAAGAALPALRRPQPAALRPRRSRRPPASRRRSCTGSAPTASCCASSPPRCWTATRPGSAASREVRRRGLPGRDAPGAGLAGGRPDPRLGHGRRRRARRRSGARRRGPRRSADERRHQVDERSGSSTQGKWPAPGCTTSSPRGNSAATSAITSGGLPVSSRRPAPAPARRGWPARPGSPSGS